MLVVLVHKDSHCLAANGAASKLEKDPTNRKYIRTCKYNTIAWLTLVKWEEEAAE